MRLPLFTSSLGTLVIALNGSSAFAETVIGTNRSVPVATATANNGSPDSIRISNTGSVKPNSGIAITVNSDHSIINDGVIQISGSNNAIGIAAEPSRSGDITNKGSIIIDEEYTPSDSDADGDRDGKLAMGNNRFGIKTLGDFNGTILNSGTITVEGNNSVGVNLGGSLTGSLTNSGTISVTGDNSVGVRTKAMTGSLVLSGAIGVQGANVIGVDVTGPIAGSLRVQGAITATGYRTTAAPADQSKLDADDLLQGGPALAVSASVSGGILLDAPPRNIDPNDKDEDDDGVDDDKESTGSLSTYGAAPALRIGSSTQAITIGPVAGSSAGGNSIVINGNVLGAGTYKGITATAISIGGLGGQTTISGGIVFNGSVAASSDGADATAVRIGALTTMPRITNKGQVTASGGNSASSKVTAILIDQAANSPMITNSGRISANAANDGTAIAIDDNSGSLSQIINNGSISAVNAKGISGKAIAIDVRDNTMGVVIRQAQIVNADAPLIRGDILLGNGDDRLEIEAGSVLGNVQFGDGSNQLVLAGKAQLDGNASFGGVADIVTISGEANFSGGLNLGGGGDTLNLRGATFSGSLAGAAGATILVEGGQLSLENKGTVALANLAVTQSGTIRVNIDAKNGQATRYDVAGSASFAVGSRLDVAISSISTAPGRYTIVSADTISGATNLTSQSMNLPYIFKSAVSSDAVAGAIYLDLSAKTESEMSLSQSQSGIYQAVFKALDSDAQVAGSFLSIKDGDSFRASLQQMLPDHAGGVFANVTQGSRATARFLTDHSLPTVKTGRWGLWIQQVAWGTAKSIGKTGSYDVTGWGMTAGAEYHTGSIGNIGVSIGYLTGNDNDQNVAREVRSEQFELAAFWRANWGDLRSFARVSFAQIGLDGRRSFAGAVGDQIVERNATGNWDGQLLSASAGVGYEARIGDLILRPQLAIDYYSLNEGNYTETGGSRAFNLIVDSRTSDELAVHSSLAAGLDLNRSSDGMTWLRAEAQGGYRQIVAGNLGDTIARFEGGEAFQLSAEPQSDGWTAGLRLIGGQGPFSLAGEVFAEDRASEVALSGRVTLRVGL